MEQINFKILSQQSKNQPSKESKGSFLEFFLQLLSTVQESKDSFSEIISINKKISFLPDKDKKSLNQAIESELERLRLNLSAFKTEYLSAKEDEDKVKIIRKISESKMLQEFLEMLLMTEEQIENIRQASRNFRKKAQSSAVTEKHLK